MTGVPTLTKFGSSVALTNLARLYRMMAKLMVTQTSRGRLLRMAVILEEKGRKKLSATSE
jgi:hypothetical protein